MILLITYLERNSYDRQGRIDGKLHTPIIMVSHGINMDNGKSVCLPQEPLTDFKGDATLLNGEWYLKS